MYIAYPRDIYVALFFDIHQWNCQIPRSQNQSVVNAFSICLVHLQHPYKTHKFTRAKIKDIYYKSKYTPLPTHLWNNTCKSTPKANHFLKMYQTPQTFNPPPRSATHPAAGTHPLRRQTHPHSVPPGSLASVLQRSVLQAKQSCSEWNERPVGSAVL